MGNPILLFFSYTMEGIIILHYSSELFNPKFGKRRIMLCLILLYIFLFFISLLNIPLLNLTLFSIFNYIYFYFLFSVSWYGAAFHTSVFTGFMSMSEYVSMTFLKYLSPTFLTDENNFSSLLIFAVVNKMIFFTFVYLLKIFLTNWSKDNYQRDKSSLLLVFFPLVSSIIMGALLSLTLDIILTPMQNFILTLTCLLMMTSCLFIFIANQHNQQKYEELTAIKLQLQKEESLAMYYQMLDEQNENQRILIHDIKKHLQSILFLNENNETMKISAYISQLLQSSELKDSLKVCDHAILNSILCRYLKQSKESHLSFHVDIRKNTTHFLEDRDLTAIFCNLLDNAFTAASQVPDGYVELFVHHQEQTRFITLSLINSCRNNPLSSDYKKLKLYPTKTGYHGIGMKSVEKVVQKYEGHMSMYYDDDTKTFHTILYMKTQTNSRPACHTS